MRQEKILFNYFSDDIETIEIKIRGMIKKIAILLTESKVEQLKELWLKNKFIRNVGQAYLQEIKIEEDTKRYIMSIGYANALFDLMQLYMDKVSDVREIEQIKTKYRDAIFEILAQRKIVMHKELAKELGVSASGLNDIIKHMNASKTQLVHIEQVSKYKFYSLTSIAYQYYIRNKETPVSPKPPRKALNNKIYQISNMRNVDITGAEEKRMELPNGEEVERKNGENGILEFPGKKANKTLIHYAPYTYELERAKL